MAGAMAKINGKLAERKVITALEQGGATFDDLLDITKLQKSFLSTVIRDLEGRGCLGRKATPRETKVGRQRHYKILIELNPGLLTPKARALEHLTHISPLAVLDLGKGARLLTDNFTDAILVNSTLSSNLHGFPLTPNCPHPPAFECYKESMEESKKRMEEPRKRYLEKTKKRELPTELIKFEEELTKFELNEYRLLKGLASFNCELSFVELLEEKDPWRPPEKRFNVSLGVLAYPDLFPYRTNLTKLLRSRIEDPEIFPALGVARQTGTQKQFLNMLGWISPLLEEPMKTKLKKDMEPRNSLSVNIPWNLAAAVFMRGELDHLEEALYPTWREKLRSSEKRKRKGKRR